MSKKIAAAVLCVIMAGCGGGGGGSSGGPISPPTGAARVLLGPLAGANVTLFRAGQFSAPLAHATTSSGPLFQDIGKFSFSGIAIDPAALYLVVVSGGSDHDADDNGVEDAAPTPSSGALHAVVRGDQLQAGGYNVSLLTEALYQRVRQALAAGQSAPQILAEMDARAAFIIRQDLNSDTVVDRRDVSAWNPATNGAAAFATPAERATLVSAVHAGTAAAAQFLDLTDTVLGDVTLAPEHPARLLQAVNGLLVLAEGSTPQASDAGRVRIYDATDPSLPVERGSVELSGFIRGVIQGQRLAYVRTTSASLSSFAVGLIDFSQPQAPVVLTETAVSAFPHGIAMHGSQVFYASGGQLTRYETSTGAFVDQGSASYNLVADGSSSSPGALAVNATRAFICDGGDGDVAVVNLSTMSQEKLLDVANTRFFGAADAVATDTRLFVSDGFHVKAVDLTALDAPAVQIKSDGAPGLQLNGNRLLAGGLLLDISQATPAVLLQPARALRGPLTLQGSTYLAFERDVHLVSIAGTTHPLISPLASSFTWPSGVVQVAQSGDNLVVVEAHRLSMVHVGSDGVPHELGSVALTDDAISSAAMAVADGVALIPSAAAGSLTAVDVHAPAAPAVLGMVSLGGEPKSLAAAQGLAYVTVSNTQSGAETLFTYSMGNGNAAIVDSLQLPDPSNLISLTLIGSHLYGANAVSSFSSESGSIPPVVRIFDVSRPSHPALAGSFQIAPGDTPPFPLITAATGGSLLVVADGLTHLYGLTNPLEPALLHSFQPSASTPALAAGNGMLFLLDTTTRAYDLASGDQLADYDIGFYPTAGVVSGGFLVLGNIEGALVTLAVANPAGVP